MPVNTTHRDYDLHFDQWFRIDDAVEGSDAVKYGVSQRNQQFRQIPVNVRRTSRPYLPRLGDQSDADYAGYLSRAMFFNASNRTLDGMSGLVMSRPPRESMAAAVKKMAEDITLTGRSLFSFVNEVLEDTIQYGRVGILTDYPTTAVDGLTRAEVETLGLRPYCRIYECFDIINWRVGTYGGVERLEMVVLCESFPASTDGFSLTMDVQYRVLELVGGVYQQTIYRTVEDKEKRKDWQPLSVTVPKMNGKPLDYIPFVIIGPETCSARVEKSPLLDIVDLNLAHFRNSADLEHGTHFVGLPTPVIAGAQKPEGRSVYIGSSEVMFLTDPQAKWGFMEFMGQGLTALQEALKSKEERMAVLGAHMLADTKIVSEAESVVSRRTYGQNSALASIARSVSTGIEITLRWMAQWAGIDDKVTYQLNTDYSNGKMSYQMLKELVAAWQAGALPTDALLENLKIGEIVNPSETLEDFTGKMQAQVVPPDTAEGAGGGLMGKLRQRLGV